MSFESFYGGRQGISFVIVKRFDGINIPNQNTTYKYGIYASNGDQTNLQFYVDAHNALIEKNEDNYKNYTWTKLLLNGQTITNVVWDPGLTGTTGDPIPVTLDSINAEGMVQCFSQGGASTNIVNYGEYVIIDTPDKNNPENGKVFRRGMAYNEPPLYGAEYIGQIVGPQGEASEIDIDKYDTIISDLSAKKGSYTLTDNDLVPGEYIGEDISYNEVTPVGDEDPYALGWYELIDEEYVLTEDTEVDNEKTYYIKIVTPIAAYNDDIKYTYVTIRDEFGNITGSLIGFKIPYLVLDIYSNFRSAYYEDGDDIPQGKVIGDRLDNDFNVITREDDGTHPFYEQWQVQIPKGIKGNSLVKTLILDSKAIAGSILYEDAEHQTPLQQTAEGNEEVDFTAYDPSADTYKLKNNKGYILKTNTHIKKLVGEYKDYSQKEQGVSSYVELDTYHSISNIKINDGINENQQVSILYSDADDYEDIGSPLNYIFDTFVVPVNTIRSEWLTFRGHLLVYYSDPAMRSSSNIAFPSAKLGQEIVGWTDLGDVQGYTGTPLSMFKVANWAAVDAYNQLPENQRAPEAIMQDNRYMGWGITYDYDQNTQYVAQFDYVLKEWNSGVVFGDGIQSPSQVICIYDSTSSRPDTNGFAIVLSQRTVTEDIN